MPDDDIGQQLIAYRAANGLTREALSRMTGIHKDTIAKWEAGKMKPGKKYEKVIRDLVSGAKPVVVVQIHRSKWD